MPISLRFFFNQELLNPLTNIMEDADEIIERIVICQLSASC